MLIASCSSPPSPSSSLAITAAAGRPSAISSAMFGPDSTATGGPRRASRAGRPSRGRGPSSARVPARARHPPATSANALPAPRAREFGTLEPGLRRGSVTGEIHLSQVARVAAGFADRRRLLRVTADERDRVAAVDEQAGERRSPRAGADDEGLHPRRTKSIATGTPSSPHSP